MIGANLRRCAQLPAVRLKRLDLSGMVLHSVGKVIIFLSTRLVKKRAHIEQREWAINAFFKAHNAEWAVPIGGKTLRRIGSPDRVPGHPDAPDDLLFADARDDLPGCDVCCIHATFVTIKLSSVNGRIDICGNFVAIPERQVTLLEIKR